MSNLKNTDYCFLIPSYNRYDKLIELLKQINEYEGASTIIYNDASNDNRYENITSNFNNVKTINGEKNNGKLNYNNTVKLLFREAIYSEFKYFIFMADDMLLCKDFIPNIMNVSEEYNIVNLFSLSAGGWLCTAYIDGAFIASKSAIQMLYNIIPNKSRVDENKSTGVWESVTNHFCRTNTNNYKLVSLNYTLMQHKGNDDSKLHPKLRLRRPITALNFYDDFYGNQIIPISESTLGYKPNGDKKKSSDAIPNGNVEAVPIAPTKKEPQSKPINNSQITSKPKKLYKPENQNTISKIPNDIALGKLRKSNLKFGKR
jgi:hypothetical protein